MHEVSGMLAARIEDLALTLIGVQPSTMDRKEWRWGRKGSLAVGISGEKRGRFFDNEAGQAGDAIDFICHLRRCTRKNAWTWALDWLGRSPQPLAVPPIRQRPQKAASDLWRAVWREALPAAGSPVEQYLIVRGLALPAAPLRYHPACPRGHDRLPAMLALMTTAAGNQPCGVHRTFLRPDGSGKADVDQAKMMLGAGGIVRLVADEDVGTGLGIAEGIETSLAIIQHIGWSPIWAVGSAGAIARFPVLDGVEALTIWCDNDPINQNTGTRPGTAAAQACAGRWYEAGREVTIQSPPAGTDWLDATQRAA